MRRVGGWYNGEDRTHRVVVERQRTGSDNENFDQQLAWSLALEDDEEDGILSRLSGINLVENPQQPREMDKLTEESFETESAKDEM